MATRYFDSKLFDFLRDLAKHNTRDWFEANRDRYREAVREPLERFVADLAPQLKTITARYVVDTRSIMRPNRDMRFSPDKSPYKTMAGALFKHEKAKSVPSSPGFMVHLEPGASFAGIGLRSPDPRTQARIRTAIVSAPTEWKRAVSGKKFRATCELSPESLVRPPRGYDPDHPLIDDLKRRHYCTITPFGDRQVCGPDFLDRYTEICRLNAPLMEFLTRSLKLAW